jgi:hypothetical protein
MPCQLRTMARTAWQFLPPSNTFLRPTIHSLIFAMCVSHSVCYKLPLPSRNLRLQRASSRCVLYIFLACAYSSIPLLYALFGQSSIIFIKACLADVVQLQLFVELLSLSFCQISAYILSHGFLLVPFRHLSLLPAHGTLSHAQSIVL